MMLPTAFLGNAITHRGLHDVDAGRAENGIKAFEAAIAGGYGIELDLQLTKDGVAMVFHDYDLGRLTNETGAVAQRSAAELGGIALKRDGGGIPTLADILTLVDGRVPLLIEIKDQDGVLGPNVGPLERATADLLNRYSGDAAVMSFNPHSIADMARFAPSVPRGLVTAAYDAENWPAIPAGRRDELREIPDFEPLDCCFISHEAADLDRPRLQEIKSAGANILCWTIRSKTAETTARRIVDNVTFEGYLA